MRAAGFLVLLLLARRGSSLIGTTWQLGVSVGQIGKSSASSVLRDGWVELTAPGGSTYYANPATAESSWTRPAELAPAVKASLEGPPLAMFAPGGGRVARPEWFPSGWARSGAQLEVPIELTFLADDVGRMEDEPLRRTHARALFARSSTGMGSAAPPGTAEPSAERVVCNGVRTRGVAWGMVELSSIEALLVCCIELPDGGAHDDVSLPPGTRLYVSTQAWRGEELARLGRLRGELRTELGSASDAGQRAALAERIKKLKRGLPQPGAPTVEVPGPWPGSVILSSHGQVAVQRQTKGLRSFRGAVEFGVVGTCELHPAVDAVREDVRLLG